MFSVYKQTDSRYHKTKLLSLKPWDKWLRYNVTYETWGPGSPSILQLLPVTGASWLAYTSLTLTSPAQRAGLSLPIQSSHFGHALGPPGCCTWFFSCLLFSPSLPLHGPAQSAHFHSGLSQKSLPLAVLTLYLQ